MIFDFSQSPFTSVCEHDITYNDVPATTTTVAFMQSGAMAGNVVGSSTANTVEVVQSSTEVDYCRNPMNTFWVLSIFTLAFIWGIYKISCMVRD